MGTRISTLGDRATGVWRLADPAQASFTRFAAIAIWMALFYLGWLWAEPVYGGGSIKALAFAIIGFGPFALWSLVNYRVGLLLTLVALPFIHAPAIPHSFTQGFGDLMAAATGIGFAARHADPRTWLVGWRRGYWWLLAMGAAMALSLVFMMPLPASAAYDLNFGLADIAGLVLDAGFLAILVGHLRTRADVAAVGRALAAMLAVVLVHGAVGLAGIPTCWGGYQVATVFSSAQRPIGPLQGSHEFMAFLVALLPLCLFGFVRARDRGRRGIVYAVAILLCAILIGTSQSRTGLLALGAIGLGWIAITPFERGQRFLKVAVLTAVPLSLAVWHYPGCVCSDAPPEICRIPYSWTSDGGILGEHHLAVNNLLYRETVDPFRKVVWAKSLSAWLEQPVSGVGTGMLPNYLETHTRAANSLLTTLAEQGVIGLVALLGWWLFVAANFWRHRRLILSKAGVPLGFAALSFGGISLVSLFHDQFSYQYIWIVFALSIALGNLADRGENFASSPTRERP